MAPPPPSVPAGFHSSSSSSNNNNQPFRRNFARPQDSLPPPPPPPPPSYLQSHQAFPYQNHYNYGTAPQYPYQAQHFQQQQQQQQHLPYPTTYQQHAYSQSYSHQQQQQQQHHQQRPPLHFNPTRPSPPFPHSTNTTAKTATTTPSPSPNKRPRIAAPPPSESTTSQFFCDPCRLPLDSQQALDAHRQSHVTCQKCDFEGAPKVVKGHFQAVHGKFSTAGFKTVTVAVPGCPVQRFTICVGNRPEDIAQWIRERKQKFPRQAKVAPKETKAVVEAKPLSSLLEGYGSSSESEKEQEHVDPKEANPAKGGEANVTNIQPGANDKNDVKKTGICHAFSKHGRCRRGDSCPYSHDTKNQKEGDWSMLLPQEPRASSTSLLQKLLQKEEERETTLALGLLKHLVRSNFLQDQVQGEELPL